MIKNRARVRERMKHKDRRIEYSYERRKMRGECKNYKEQGRKNVKLI